MSDLKLITYAEEEFPVHTIERMGLGGGIIPISIDECGEVHVLLGREKYISTWKGSCRWSGFEGTRKEHESIREAVLREFREETMGVVMSANVADHMLRDHHYWLNITLKIDSQSKRGERYHSTYIPVLPWNPTIPQSFQQVRSTVEHIDRLSQELRLSRPDVLSSWTCKSVGPMTHIGDAIQVQVEHSETGVIRAPWTMKNDCLTGYFNDVRKHDILNWCHLRDRLQTLVRQNPHESVHVKYDDRWHLLQDVRVCKDHLEKDQIRWWKVPDLLFALQNKGTIQGERFRPYFMPILETLLQEIKHRPPTVADMLSSSLSFTPSFPLHISSVVCKPQQNKNVDKENNQCCECTEAT